MFLLFPLVALPSLFEICKNPESIYPRLFESVFSQIVTPGSPNKCSLFLDHFVAQFLLWAGKSLSAYSALFYYLQEFPCLAQHLRRKASWMPIRGPSLPLEPVTTLTGPVRTRVGSRWFAFDWEHASLWRRALELLRRVSTPAAEFIFNIPLWILFFTSFLSSSPNSFFKTVRVNTQFSISF